MRHVLLPLTGAFLLAVPTLAAEATLSWTGGQLGGTVTYDLMGDGGQLFALKPSMVLQSTPLPGGTLDIGLDLVGLMVVGQLSFGSGTAQVAYALPNDISFSGLPLHAQFVTLPGPFGIVDEVSNRTTFVTGFPNSIHPTFGDVAVPRSGHTVTELGDGRVVLAGGVEVAATGSFVTASIEIYNPDTQEFAELPTGLAAGRTGHTATRLFDNRVLLVGGFDSTNTPLATAEVFDPVTNTATPVPNMSTARTFHTATRLNDGRVLVLAGTSSFNASDIVGLAAATLQSSELFDPNTNTWSNGPDLPISGPYGAIGQATSVLPSGRVLVTGGLVVGSFFGIPTPAVSNGAWRYDPITNGFLATSSMATPRLFHGQTTLPDGRALVVGGSDLDILTQVATPLASCERYTAGGSFAAAPALNHARAYPNLIDTGLGLVVLGGLATANIATVSGTPEPTIELAPYSVAQWTDGPDLLGMRQLVSATTIDSGQRILITGAGDGPPVPDASAEQYLR
ncbi:MAG: kelch repeat-containing protein [Planctomycetota bacterium]